MPEENIIAPATTETQAAAPTTTTPASTAASDVSSSAPDITPSQAAAAAAKPTETKPVETAPAETKTIEAKTEEPAFDLEEWDADIEKLPADLQPLAKKYEDMLITAEEEIKAYEAFIKDMEVDNLPAFKAVKDELEQTKKELEEARKGGEAITETTSKLKKELEEARSEAKHVREAYEERIAEIAEREMKQLIAQHKAILTAPENKARVDAVLDDPEHWDLTHLVDLVTLEPEAFKEAQELVKEMSPERAIELVKLKSRAKTPSTVAKNMVSTGVRPAPPAKAEPVDYETRLERAAKAAFDRHKR